MPQTVYAAVGFLLIVSSFNIDTMAQTRSTLPCSVQRIQGASSAYNIGQFSTTFQLLSPCLPYGFSEQNERSDAWRLMALSYLAVDSLGAAEESVRSLLRVDKRFRPDPQSEPPIFVNLVYDLKPKWYTWPWKGGEWTKWVGRAALVGTAFALPALLKSSELSRLPDPPVTPRN